MKKTQSRKTKILRNSFATDAEHLKQFVVIAKKIDITGNVDYLGRKLSFDDLHATEIINISAQAWSNFIAIERELCNEHYPLMDRLFFFSRQCLQACYTAVERGQ